MSELGIYEGCYAELRNGDVVGPLKRSTKKVEAGWPWYINEGVPCWTEDGHIGVFDELRPQDIVRVLPGKPMQASDKPKWNVCGQAKATIPPHVTRAAMDAGIKVAPDYEQFVNAVLEAGFKAQYGIEFVPVVGMDFGPTVPRYVIYNALDAAITGPKNGDSRREGTTGERLAYLTDAVVAAISKNESENRIRDSEKAKGGLSDPTSPPLNDMTICFTGALNIPIETHKGIAESLGANVAGSVHKHTTLVVFGPGAGSKLDKAVEHNIPRMSESAWMWLAARFGYGKATHVSPYGKFSDDLVVSLRLLAGNVGSVLFSHRQKLNAAADELERLREQASTPSVQTIIEAIGAAVREWRETHPDMGMVPPISMIAKKVHAVIAGEARLSKEERDQINRDVDRFD